jgi:phage/plasmid-like protein (TIGR03299 family)
MPAKFENGVFGSNVPAWHGAGTVLPEDTFDWETVKRHVPELGYAVAGQPLYAIAEDGHPIRVDGYVANVRSDGTILGVVGSGYVPVQGDEAFGFLSALCQSGEVIVHTAGTLDGGRKAWIQCLAANAFRIAGEASEEHRGYVSFMNSFDGSTKVGAITGATRVVCQNTYNAAIRGASGSYWFKHTSDVMTRVAEARLALKIGQQYWSELERIGNMAILRPFSDRQFAEVIDAVVPVPDAAGRKRDNAERERETINQLWRDSATVRNVAHTAWAAVNVFTEFSDHHIRSRETERNSVAENRLKRIWLDTSLKNLAIAHVYTIADVK